MDEVLAVGLQEVVLFVSMKGSTTYFPAELTKAIEIGENPGRGGMGVVLYEMATCELAFEDSASAAIFDTYPSQYLLNLHRLRGEQRAVEADGAGLRGAPA